MRMFCCAQARSVRSIEWLYHASMRPSYAGVAIITRRCFLRIAGAETTVLLFLIDVFLDIFFAIVITISAKLSHFDKNKILLF
jgi:hypothetical protein